MQFPHNSKISYQNEQLANLKTRQTASPWAINTLIASLSLFIISLSLFLFQYSYQINQNQKLENSSGEVKSAYEEISNSQSPDTAFPVPQTPANLELNTVFFGDVFWGRRMNKWSKADPLGTAFPFSGLETLRGEDEQWIANLECPVTTKEVTEYEEETLLSFNCPPEYLAEASKHFSVFSLANNHTDNRDKEVGLEETREHLEKYNLQFFGNFDNSIKEDICEVVSFPVKATLNSENSNSSKNSENFQETTNISSEFESAIANYDFLTSENSPKDEMFPNNEKLNPKVSTLEKQEDYYMPIALCGYHNVFALPTEDQLAVISDYSKYFPTIVMPHQGAEYITVPDQLQQQFYRQMIDLGADAVIAGHTHSVLPTESYKGKLIAYSLGNFIFDQQQGLEVTRGLGVNLKFSFQYDEKVQALAELAPNCKLFQEDCLQKAIESNLKKPGFKLDYDLKVSQNQDKVTTKADENLTQLTLERTKWAEVKPNLQTDFSFE